LREAVTYKLYSLLSSKAFPDFKHNWSHNISVTMLA